MYIGLNSQQFTNVCPTCGVVLSNSGSASPFQSSAISRLQEDVSINCLCRNPIEDVQQMHDASERKLQKFLSEHFPGIKRSEFNVALDGLDRNDPLRVEFVLRLQNLNRLQMSLKEKRKNIQNTDTPTDKLGLSQWFQEVKQ